MSDYNTCTDVQLHVHYANAFFFFPAGSLCCISDAYSDRVSLLSLHPQASRPNTYSSIDSMTDKDRTEKGLNTDNTFSVVSGVFGVMSLSGAGC